MLEQLRDSFIVYKESCSRCKIKLRKKRKCLSLSLNLIYHLTISQTNKYANFWAHFYLNFKYRVRRAVQEVLLPTKSALPWRAWEIEDLPEELHQWSEQTARAWTTLSPGRQTLTGLPRDDWRSVRSRGDARRPWSLLHAPYSPTVA